MLSNTFYSNGKLLLTAEYLVLDGAKAIALPTKFGQDFLVEKINKKQILWESYDLNNNIWFSCKLSTSGLNLIDASVDANQYKIALGVRDLLNETKKLNPKFLDQDQGYHFKTNLTFPRNWGLGSSSTLVNNIAQFANIDPFKLLKNTFGGSGYDIACAQNNTPISYQIKTGITEVKPVHFQPSFQDQLYFIYLNKKQNSRDGIAQYNALKKDILNSKNKISELSNLLLEAKSINDFEQILSAHEFIISKILNQKPIQQRLFSDYFGQTKSLGAWGGDFILATGNDETPNYFKNKGFETILKYKDMIL